jgi:hemolysin activation/secretion protein
MKRQLTLPLSLSLAFLFVSGDVLAQVPNPAPAQTGRQAERTRIQEARPEVGGMPIITVPDDEGKDKKLSEGATFTIKGVSFEGNTSFTSEELTAEFQEYLNTKINLGTLNKAAGKITAKYRNAGYILSRAVIPPQRIGNGVLKIRIVEGFVNQVTIEGLSDETSRLAQYAEKIRGAKPLDSATLERYLLLMEDLPGVKAHAVIRPAQGVSGASDIVIQIEEKPVDVTATMDNRGTRYLGPVEFSFSTAFNNLMGMYDRTQVRLFAADNTNELKYGQIVQEFQLDDEGTKLQLSAGRTRTNPGYTLKNFDIVGKDTTLSAAVSHPFIRSRETNLFGHVKFDWRNTSTDALDTALFRDRLRVLRTGAAYDFVDQFAAVNKIETEVSRGFKWDGYGRPALQSRARGDMDFSKITAYVSRLQPIEGPFNLFVAAQGQKSGNVLLSAEQFGVGGPNFGSAYDTSEIIGDDGVAARAELQFSGMEDVGFFESYQLYGFYDVGKVWSRTVVGPGSTAALASTGLGVRFDASQPLSGGFEIALPTTRKVAAYGQDGGAPRFFFDLSYRY